MSRRDWLIRVLVTLALMIVIALVIILPTVPARAAELPRCTTDPAEPCNLSASGYNLILDGTELDGIGQALESGEKLYKVNGIFVLAVIMHESGRGTSRLAQEENNLGGIKGRSGYRSFYNKEICVLYMFGLFERKYAGKTVEEIAPIYCETDGWADSVNSIMKELIESAGETRD